MERSYSKSASKSPTSVLDQETSDIPDDVAETLQEYLARQGYSGSGMEANSGKEMSEMDKVDDGGEDANKPEPGDYSYASDLEARAAIKFDMLTFVKEFVNHTFYPLTIPLLYYLDGGWLGLRNRSFIGHKTLSITQLFWALNFYVLNVTSFMYIYEAENLDYLYDILLVDLLWVIRNMVVATKYAFLSKIEMEEMRTKIVPSYVHTYRTLLAAWKDPIPSTVMKHELLLGAMRHKLMALKNISFDLDTTAADSTQAVRDLVLDLRLGKRDFNSLSFSYGKRAHEWLQLGCGQFSSKDPLAWIESGGVETVEHLPVRLYAAHVIRQGSSLSRLKRVGHSLLSQHTMKCATVIGAAHAIIPGVLRFIFGGHKIPGPKWVTYCYLIPSFLLVTFTMISNVGFMMIGVLDFRRRHYFAESLDEVLRTGIYAGANHVRRSSLKNRSTSRPKTSWFPFPRRVPSSTNGSSRSSSGSGKLSGEGIFIDFNSVNSLLAWWTCRQLLTGFGYGFYRRIKYYTTYFAGYCTVLLTFLVMKMLTGIKETDFYLLGTVAYSIYVFLTLLALMVWPGGDTNLALQQHGVTLIKKKIHQQMMRYKAGTHLIPEPDATRARASSDTINSISEAVKWENSQMKLSICGFEARDQLVSLIVAVVTASISIGIGQIVQNGLST